MGNVKTQGSGILTFNNEVYESQSQYRREVAEWIDILVASKRNPVLAELVKELKTVHELSKEPRPRPTETIAYYAPYIPPRNQL